MKVSARFRLGTAILAIFMFEGGTSSALRPVAGGGLLFHQHSGVVP